MFLFGYFFYLATPLIVGYTGVFTGLPGVDLFQEVFGRMPPSQVDTYLIVAASWLPAFFAGDFIFRLLYPVGIQPRRFERDALSGSLWLVSILLLLVLLAFTYLARGSILGGYASYDIGARGKLSTLLMVVSFFLVYDRITNQSHSILLPLIAVLTSLLLLSMGGRMYAFQFFVVLLVYKTSLSGKPWSMGKVLFFMLVAFVIGGALGAWRMGLRPDVGLGLYSFFAEPAFTWFSVMTYLSNNDVSAFHWPGNYLSSFLNLVPNTLFSVRPYLVSLESMAVGYRNPLGADSIWTNLVINFGSVGSVFFMFGTGFILAALKRMAFQRRFWAAYYLMVCGIIPFQFFRDGFYILHKQILFNFLLFPAVVLLILRLMLFLQQAWMRKTAADINARTDPAGF
jgi:hypothetical protein